MGYSLSLSLFRSLSLALSSSVRKLGFGSRRVKALKKNGCVSKV